MIELLVGILSLALVVGGLASLRFSSTTEPNPYSGFRVPATLVSRRVWRRANRLMGILITIIGFSSLLVSLILGALHAVFFIAISVACTSGSLSLYFSSILEKETGREEGGEKPLKILQVIKVSYEAVVFACLSLITTSLYLVSSYPALPDIIAVHFDVYGRPNYFMTKGDFTATFLILFTALVYSLSAILASAHKVPLSSDSEKKRYVLSMIKAIKASLIALSILMTIVVLLIVHYNSHSYFTYSDIILLALPTLAVFLLYSIKKIS
ncbi:MAG TPA: DUF1648 domain-containing protein [Thermoprotei archaeon]|nr:DUF1648 domain-containing protein [Thermoprotei archaeon]